MASLHPKRIWFVPVLMLLFAQAALAQSFSNTGAMSIRRLSATATVLLNGQVLIAGGRDASSARGTAELYDPVTGRFTTTGSMIRARQEHTATLLPDGTVLVAGGVDNDSKLTATAEIYHPSNGTFTATGNLLQACKDHSATLLVDGHVLLTGCGGASAELYDPATGAFVATGSMHDARSLHTATLLANGKVLLAGGDQAGGPGDATAEIFDPAVGVFSSTGSMTGGRFGHSATLLFDGRVLIAGGVAIDRPVDSAEVYSPASGTFTATDNMSVARAYFPATLLPNGQVLLSGGQTLDSNQGPLALNACDLYDVASGAFAPTSNMNAVRNFNVAAVLARGRVLETGGGVETAELYNPASTPAVKILSPIGAAVVQNTVTIQTTAGPQAEWISVYIDQQYLASSPPFNFTWDSTKVSNGLHTITVRAFAGNSRIGIDSIQVDVENTTGPIHITSPVRGATVSGKVAIVAPIDSSVTWENIYIDGSYLSSSPPTTHQWDTTKFANGPHVISANAYSSSGQLLGSESIRVDVENATTIASPSEGASLKGTVAIVTRMASNVTWENIYIDGRYLGSSPPTSFNWNSATVPNGGHAISATAYGSNGIAIGSTSVTITVAN